MPRFSSGQLLKSMAGAMKSCFFRLNMASPKHGNTKQKAAKTRVFFVSSSGDERWHEQCLVVSRGMASLQAQKPDISARKCCAFAGRTAFYPGRRKARSVVNTDAFAGTLSSCGHACSGHSHAVVTRTLSSCGHGCCGNTDIIIVRTWMLW